MIQQPTFQYVTMLKLRLDQLKFCYAWQTFIYKILLLKKKYIHILEEVSTTMHCLINVFFVFFSHGINLQNVYKAENRLLFWLLIIFAFLIALAILTLLLCCTCPWCPLYDTARWVITITILFLSFRLLEIISANISTR